MGNRIGIANGLLLAVLLLLFSSFASATTPTLIGNNPANVVEVSNSVIDLGQSTTFNVIVSNGIAPYTGNWVWIAPNAIQANSLSITTNTLTANILSGALINSVLTVSTSSGSTNTIHVTFNGITNTINLDSTHTVYGLWTFNANVIDSASHTLGSATQTTSNTVTIDPPLVVPTISASNSLVDANQYIRFSAYETGGAPSYTYNILVYNSVTNTQIGNFLSTTANSFVFQALAGNSIYANVIVTDSASTPVTLNSLLTPAIPVNAVLAAPTIAASNTVVNTNQYVRFSSYETGGTLPYTYNFLVYNSVTNIQVANMLTTSNSFLWQVTGNSGNTLAANVFVTDSASAQVTINSVLSSTITVNSVLATPTIAISNTLVDVNQYVTFSSYESGGTPPYAYNFIVSNSTTNAILTTSGYTSANTFTYQILTTGNTIQANVLVEDSAPTNSIANSVNSGQVGVNSVLAAGLLTESYTSITDGESVTLTSAASGGTTPYTINWFSQGGCSGASQATGTTYSPSPASTATYSYNVVDSATTPNTVCSNSNTVTVYPVSGGGAGAGVGGSGSSTTVTTTIAHTTTTTIPATTTVSAPTTTPTVNSTYNISSNTPTLVSVPKIGLSISITAAGSASSKANVRIINVTGTSPPAPHGFNKLDAINITITSAASVFTNVTLSYPCSIQSSKIVPYIFSKGAWQKIAKFTVNSAKCSVAFSITDDPVIGIFQNATQPSTTSTSVQTTTVPPSTTAQPAPPEQSPASNNSYIIWAIVVVVVIVVAAWYITRGRKRR